MSTESSLSTQDLALIEKVAVKGNIALLSSQERISYYMELCNSMKLSPFTRPFDFLEMKNRDGSTRIIPYANRDCTDQLRRLHNVSIRIVGRELVDDVYVITAQATNSFGRCDESTGVVGLSGTTRDGKSYRLSGDARANKIMHAETKAKRRATLSLVGLGILDESEARSIRGARAFSIDLSTGEVLEKELEDSKQDFLAKKEDADITEIPKKTALDDSSPKSNPMPSNLISREQVFELSKLMFDTKSDSRIFNEYYKVGGYAQMTIEKFEHAKKGLVKKMAEINASNTAPDDYVGV